MAVENHRGVLRDVWMPQAGGTLPGELPKLAGLAPDLKGRSLQKTIEKKKGQERGSREGGRYQLSCGTVLPGPVMLCC